MAPLTTVDTPAEALFTELSVAMLPAVAAASPGLYHLPRYHHLGRRFHLRHHRLLPATPARPSCGVTRARRLLLAGAFASGEGPSGQVSSWQPS